MSKHFMSFSLGILFVAIFSIASIWISAIPFLSHLGISPLIVAIVLGIIYGNSLHHRFTSRWHEALKFSTKRILRLAIVLYGFRISFQDLTSIGYEGVSLGVLVVISTLLLGIWLGKKLHLDKELSLLISAGAAICGAAAVLATEGILRSNPYKAAIAIASVVLLGTVGMFLYPVLENMGYLKLSAEQYGIFSGATIYEVAQVVVAGGAVSIAAGKLAIITKMLRVMFLAPYLLILSRIWKSESSTPVKNKIIIPWFAFGFILAIAFNSLHLLSETMVNYINQFDTFLLVMAMSALGIETHLSKMKGIGFKPLCLALSLFVWVSLGIYLFYIIAIHLS